jgi:hypothetical protein
MICQGNILHMGVLMHTIMDIFIIGVDREIHNVIY